MRCSECGHKCRGENVNQRIIKQRTETSKNGKLKVKKYCVGYKQ